MNTPSLIIEPRAFQAGALLGYRPSLADPNKVIPVEVPFVRAAATPVARRRNKAGVWVTCPANTPRLHWNVEGTEASLLAEKQATNILLQSGDLDAWNKAGGATVNNNVINSPIDGVMYDRLNVSNSAYVSRGSLTLLSNTTYTLSCIVKNDTLIAGENIRIMLNNNRAAPDAFILSVNFNIVAGTATYTLGGTVTTGFVGTASGKITQEIDGSWRIEVTGTTGSGTMGSSGTVEFYSPQGAKSYFATAPQLETGSSTSPIITLGSTVTRNADTIPNFAPSNLFNGSNFTWNIKVLNNQVVPNAGTHIAGLGITGPSRGLYLANTLNGSYRIWLAAANVVYVPPIGDINLVITNNGSFVNIWCNGIKVVTNYAYDFTTPVNFVQGSVNAYINLAFMSIRPLVLSDAECLALSNL
jgi:hypothetical protein